MSDLPEAQSAVFDPPITHTGVDYFGPITIKRWKRSRKSTGTDKSYGVVFTCLTYRAVHLELAGDLSTDFFIMALHRFTSRRGNPRSMWSSNGQNFVGANQELKFLLKGLDQTAITNNLSIRNIQWHFIPPSSPWIGGAWGSLVKVTKEALKSVTNKWQIREDHLITTLAQIDGTINSRPLTSISDDADDLTVLTTNHFISGRSLNTQGVVDINEKDIDSRRKWKVVEGLSNIYWKRFIKYIPSFKVRKKRNKVRRNVKVNDIVLLYESNTPRSYWPLARVIKVNPSKDELVESVTLKLPNTALLRPRNKLCLLEESTRIHSNEFSLAVEEFCVYWHCKKRENRNVTLSVVGLSPVILVSSAGFYLHFPAFL